MDSTNVRVRFAPSPTGPLHVGGVRTALYNYLFARNKGGKMILRIEDTDLNRYVPGAEDYIINSLEWCGIKFDEGVQTGGPFSPYRQSERKEIYGQYALNLISKGHAYYAFDTPEELDKKRHEYESSKQTFIYDATVRKEMNNSLTLTAAETERRINSSAHYVIRFKIPEDETIVFNDLIRGEISVDTSTLDDKVLFKSDGMPTYHLANIVDDHLMEISHVIRGEEWLPSLPLHVLLYRAFGWTPPLFAHLPLILKPEGSGKLSKRDGDRLGFPVFPLEWKDPFTNEISSGFRESGYFPEAVVNMLALLGWNPGIEKEIFSMDELIQVFSLERIGKSGSRFDPDKARWFNHHYLVNRSDDELTSMYEEVLKSKGITVEDGRAKKIVKLIKDRAHFVHEFWDQSSFFFNPPETYDVQNIRKKWKDNTPSLLKNLMTSLSSLPEFSSEHINEAIENFAATNQVGFGQIMNPLRICLVGGSFGPDLPDICELLGKEEMASRIERALDLISNE